MGTFEHFEILIPKLGRLRKVTVFLPEGYGKEGQRYPVLYMHDGQNLFHRDQSSYGETWEVPAAVDTLVGRDPESGIIVVGIDNGGEARLDEYSPWHCPPLGRRLGGDLYKKGFGGEGDEYSDFLVENLKPLIDAAYRTKPERESTGVMGSSMGGYISIYLGARYPHVFSRVGALSPSVGVEKERLREALLDMDNGLPMKWYLDTGTNEHDNKRKWRFNRKYVEDARMVAETLKSIGTPDDRVRFLVEEGAVHNEKAWAGRFPDALDWLYSGDLDSSQVK